jgi:hypothetical protein
LRSSVSDFFQRNMVRAFRPIAGIGLIGIRPLG